MTFSSAPAHSRAFSLRASHRQNATSGEASFSRALPCRRRRRRRLSRATTAEREETKEEPRGGEKKSEKKKKIVIVGAGWGGWGAAKALSESEESDVILLDGLDDPTGKTAPRTPSGKPFEAGVRGFWKDYPNINYLVENTLGLNENEVFTEFTRSSFFSPDGLEATAPVFSGKDLMQLPSPLGQVFATFDNFKRLPLADRATMVGLLYAVLDLNRNEKVFEKYDRATAHELFTKCGLSERLVEEFLKPTLLVGLFKPPEELSAAVTMELLYYYALAHQDSFDVRWIKSKSIGELIIAPMAEMLMREYDLDVKGGCFAKSLHFDSEKKKIDKVTYFDTKSKKEVVIEDVDGVVLALGAKGLKSVVSNSTELARNAPELTAAASLGAIDVISVRLWLDKYVATDTPANVFSRFPALRGAGGTFFMLDQLQKDTENELWGGQETPKGSVVACDFYNSSAIATLSDEDIVKTLTRDLLPEAVEAFRDAGVVDFCVQRYPQAVSHFSPGSFAKRPPLQTSIANVVCAGDWVRMGDREFGAKGLCQERAFVSGIEAGNALLVETLGVSRAEGKKHPVIPIRADEMQVEIGRAVNKNVLSNLDAVFDGAFNVFGLR
jgi:uncharacterized protein with NAD-binding domain and iron-sulfur cluster